MENVTGGTKQASNYEKTTKFLINYIKGEFLNGNDIIEFLRKLEYTDPKKWYLKVEENNKIDPTRKNIRDKEVQMAFKTKLDAVIKIEFIYERNRTKVYSLI